MSAVCPCKKDCPLSHALSFVGGKWKIPVICSLDRSKTLRYNQLKAKISGITNTMLAKTLKELEHDKLVVRVQYNEIPLRVEYSLTEKASSLIPILKQLSAWGADLPGRVS